MERFLGGVVDAGAFSSAIGLVATAREIVWEGAAGQAREGAPATTATRFDYASLTKPFVATLALTLDADGVLPLAARIGDLWPQAHRTLARRSLSDLLRHRSGLAGWTPLYDRCRSMKDTVALIVRGGNDGDLMGARTGTYSDLGYILWGRTAEIATATPLADLLRSRVLEPLGLATVEPTPPGDWADLAESHMGTGMEMKLAAKQGFIIPDLGPPPVGMPQDGNGRFLIGLGAGGGVCGHIGLFGGIRDLWRLAVEWLTPGRLLKPEGVAAALAGGGPFALGWWRRTLRNSAGRALPPTAFGHTGFAGNSFWIDPDGRHVFVMLGSRCDPLSDVNRWRRRFNTAAARITLEFEREGTSADGHS
jgi:CubicO group peptidase (beta-lactamase class C family)